MTSPGGPTKPLSSKALRRLVSDLAGKIDRLEQEVEQLRLDNSNLRRDNQALRDEIARLKNLPPRPPFKASGMEKAIQPRPAGPGRRPGRGAKRDRVTREVTIRAEVPPGSRFKGYKTVVHRDLVLAAEVVRYKRERWVTPEGQTIIAPLPVGVAGAVWAWRAPVLPRPAHARPGDHRAADRSAERHRPGDLQARGRAPAHHRSGAVRTGRPCDPASRPDLLAVHHR